MGAGQKISILNQTFAIDSDESPEHVARVANYVNKKVKEIKNQSKSASSLQIALLTSLNIAGELIKLQTAQRATQQAVTKKIDALIQELDQAL